MSAVEFGLTSQTPFVYEVSQRPFEQLLTESEALEARFGALSHLSRSIASSIASMTPEVLSHNGGSARSMAKQPIFRKTAWTQ